jgi:hypothetical protein
MLNNPFIPLSRIDSITPLGNLAPPGHTLPTEHWYINVAREPNDTRVIPIASPGSIWITHINGGSGQDYSVHFSLCQDVFGYFNHLDGISPLLQDIIVRSGCSEGASLGNGGCVVQVLEPVDPGAVIGTVRTEGNFDLGIWDMRSERAMANPSRYVGRSIFITCSVGYFADTLRDTMSDLLEQNGSGRCGTVTYDVPGTLAGNWFLDDAAQHDEGAVVVFVYDNLLPEQAVIAVGGTLTNAGKLEFTPVDSGTVNRRASQVTNDGQTYCYERDGTGRHEQYSSSGNLLEGHLLVLMVNEAEALMAHGDGPCAAGLPMDGALTYIR